MTSFIYFLGHCFELIFKIVPHIGRVINMTFIGLIFIGVFYWISYMMKNPKENKNYLSKH